MLAKQYRFHGHKSLGFVYRKGQSVRDQLVVIKYTTNSRRQHSRISVVVSRKTCKFAVGRNRIRRRIYEVFRHHLADFSAAYDIVVIVTSSDIATIPHTELQLSIDKLLEKAGTIKLATSGIISEKGL
ncbi:MAG TPA: ribonuclease P protein component [Candidatus Saccharibacteria bacterium]|nr:ribonuclease P protein component [Candidatus Saccharibacteria bacterium]HMR38170.1 ribonuclease P protein component [Candidatus Saccharibacteria bacterium]